MRGADALSDWRRSSSRQASRSSEPMYTAGMSIDKLRFWRRKEVKKAEAFEYVDEISFEDAFLLAKGLSDAVDARNAYTDQFGGFDTFADVDQHVGRNREIYDEFVGKYNDARKAFDNQVKNKQGLVKKIRIKR